MKQRIQLLLTLLFLWTSIGLFAQNEVFAPKGAIWYYRGASTGYTDPSAYTFTVSKDTLIDGLLARELTCDQWDNGRFQPFPLGNKYVHTNGDKVYYRVKEEWVQLFDFDAVVGDTIASKVEQFPIDDGCSYFSDTPIIDFQYRVDSIGIERVQDTALRVQYVRSIGASTPFPWSMGMPNYSNARLQVFKIVERLGAISAGYWWGQGSACISETRFGYLRCYHDNNMDYIGHNYNESCDFVDTIAPPYEFHFYIYPTPTSSNAFVTWNYLYDGQLYFTLFNTIGQQIWQSNTNMAKYSAEIPMKNLPKGMYYLQIKDEKGTTVVEK
jgi:Secretion system C-terminal sorting domain